jgi:hypothetical protein
VFLPLEREAQVKVYGVKSLGTNRQRVIVYVPADRPAPTIPANPQNEGDGGHIELGYYTPP